MFNEITKLLKDKTLVYAEDEFEIRKHYGFIFSQVFKNVYPAENGQQLVELYHSNKPDLLIIDYVMPVMSGLDAAKAIREIDKNIVILFITARNELGDFREYKMLDITDVLIKPVIYDELEAALEKCAIRLKLY